MHFRTRILAALLGATLAACDAVPERRNEQAGLVIGSVIGGVVGSRIGHGSGRTAATIVGTVIGAAVGGAVGRSMDDTDRLKTAHALETVRTNVPSRWRNPDTGHEYIVTPTRTYDTNQGPCREYTVQGVIDGQVERIHGTACRQADGSWRAAG